MTKSGTPKVFDKVAKILKRISIRGVTIQTNARNMSVKATYIEDETSVPISMELKLPNIYPFKQIDITTDFGNIAMSKKCDHLVHSAIVSREALDAGIFAWHDFIVKEMQEKEPCTICYSFLDDNQKVPKVKCATCGQRFHGSCLSKWFAHCLQPTCPYCASPWKPKG